jgi:hypothetical protein
MPVSALSPYVPDAIFSEDRSKELRLILHGIELQLRLSMDRRQKRLLKQHGLSKSVKLTDWSSIVDVTDVTLSRYNQGESTPPLPLLQSLRMIFDRVERDPQPGVDALIDYLNRKAGPSIGDIKFPGDVIKVPEGGRTYSSISGSIDQARGSREPPKTRAATRGQGGSSGQDDIADRMEVVEVGEEPA